MNQKIEKMVIKAKEEIADNYNHDERCEDYFDDDASDRKKWMEEYFHVSYFFL